MKVDALAPATPAAHQGKARKTEWAEAVNVGTCGVIFTLMPVGNEHKTRKETAKERRISTCGTISYLDV